MAKEAKLRRSARLADLALRFLEEPGRAFSLGQLARTYGAAKSSLSEDLSILREVFLRAGIGTIETSPGAAGGARYVPGISRERAENFVRRLVEEVTRPERILPGGFVYLSDLLGRPDILRNVGRIVAATFASADVDVVLTVETKGIPIAYAASFALGKPVVIARRDGQITEGSLVTINYLSASSRSIRTMSLSRRAIVEGSRVLLVDDFLRGGGTIRGMQELVREFRAEGVGAFVFVEGPTVGERVVEGVASLVKVEEIDPDVRRIRAVPGSIFSRAFLPSSSWEGLLQSQGTGDLSPERDFQGG
ncbi:MAG: PurR: transcription regulator associated with purine metabolism [Brockia lithotrophica]|uniref:PurR: transcription regulator associated with purine metabolism n=1 Tax=Brockia lithotrophica TaxID=933949 RepID=A0A2T5G583_9BACL|nr:MAG: PurR: transcription regulator associated with purine metabolism [Brockia lithotrophica]